MTLKITANISKGNSNGVGFIRIPILNRKGLRVNDYFKVTIVNDDSNPYFYGRIKNYGGLGIYVPKELMIKNNLLKKEFQIFFEKIDGFYAKLCGDGRFYIPNNIFKTMGLKRDDIIMVSAVIDNKTFARFCRVRKWINDNGVVDCYCMFGPEFSYKKGVFKIKEKIEKPNKFNEITKIIKDLDFGMSGYNAIVFDGHKVPITINTNVKLSEIAYYLGHFFADGTKKGNSWGLCISTFEQAIEFLKMHKEIIPDSRLDMYISYSDSKKRDLRKKWYRETGINVKKTRFYKTDISKPENRNEFGTLVAKEHRKLTQVFYNRLIDLVFERAIKNGDKSLAIDFICGVLEGDGSPSSKSHGHITISTNQDDAIKLEKILRISGLQFKLHEEKKRKRFYIRIGSLTILINLPIIKDKLFRYYPKRRKKFIYRFINIGANRFILGKQKHASPWVKSYLKDNNILDENYTLTKHGSYIKKCLREMENEIR